MADTSSTNDGPSGTSHFLKLPAELRNHIYELTFTTSDGNGAGIPLMKAAGPSKALLITCRQIYSEARLFHRSAFRQYWQTNTFVLDHRVLDAAKNTPRYRLLLRDLGEVNVNAITDIICLFFHDTDEWKWEGRHRLTTWRTRGGKRGKWCAQRYDSVLHVVPHEATWYGLCCCYSETGERSRQILLLCDQLRNNEEDTMLRSDGEEWGVAPLIEQLEVLCFGQRGHESGI